MPVQTLISDLLAKPLPPGTPAPDFSLPDQDGNRVTLSELRGRKIVLIFYPGDNTPICRAQLCELRDREADLRGAGIAVLGINPQSATSHRSFRERNRLPFPLLVDQGSTVCRAYRTAALVTRRTVYGIDQQGVIRFARRGRPSTSEILASFD